MTNQPTENTRSVQLTRTGSLAFEATNSRGGKIQVGSGSTADFSPVELLLVALGACSSIDVDYITSRRAEPESFVVRVTGEKVKDDHGAHLVDPRVEFEIRFPAGPAGDEARERLPQAVRQSHEALCTVSRTIELPTPVEMRLAD